MTGFGKPNATGRSTHRLTGWRKSRRSPPEGEPWVWVTRELLASDAWQGMSLTARRLLDFILIEHMNHSGTENGNLMATYEQLKAFGLHQDRIHLAIEELEMLGLVRFEKAGYRRGGILGPTRFRLTFQGDNEFNFPTNEWKATKRDHARTWKRGRNRKQRTPREDIEVPPETVSGKSDKKRRLRLVSPPETVSEQVQKL